MNISKEAIEAAAREVFDEMPSCAVCLRPGAACTYCTDDATRYARAALEAAAPLLVAQAWDEGRAHGAMWPYGYRGLGTDDNPYRKEKS